MFPDTEDVVPVVIATIAENGFEAVVTQLDVGPAATMAAAVVLSKRERERANRFIFQRDRDRFIVARAGLRRLLASRLDLPAEAIEFEYGAHGKPALAHKSGPNDLRFNVSHSENVAIYAFADGRAVGVDIEAVREIQDRDDIATHCFSANENKAYLLLGSDERSQAFFNGWTRKEAFIKATGDGMHRPLDSFDVSLRPDEPARILRVGERNGEDCGWLLYSFSPLQGFVSAVVIERTGT